MNNVDNNKPEIAENTEENYVPFVNEECGDTMWDQVLKEAEERDRKERNAVPPGRS